MPNIRFYSLFVALLFLFSLPANPANGQSGFLPNLPASTSDTIGPRILLPGLSPYLIGQRQWELQAFGTVNSQKLENQMDTTNQLRLTSGNYLFLFMLGIDPKRRFNVGLEAQVGSFRQTLADGDDPTMLPSQYRALGALGLRVRVAPLASLPELTLQGALLLPAASDRTTRQALGRDRAQMLIQANFYQQFLPWLYIFLQADASVLFKNRERQHTTYSFPLGLYAVAEVAPQRFYIIPSLSYAGHYTSTYRGPLLASGSQALGGLGVQYAFSPRVSLNLQGQIALSYSFKSQIYDYVSGSYSAFSVGLRCLN